VQRYLLEIAFIKIFDLQPVSREEGFREMEKILQGGIQSHPPVAYPRNLDDERISVEAERKLKVFLKDLGKRVRRRALHAHEPSTERRQVPAPLRRPLAGL
jgi:hypothetical protein